MTEHPTPRRPRRQLNRRDFLGRAALAGVAFPSMAALLEACSKASPSGAPAAATLTIATPDHPVTWPLPKDNPAIASGLTPERGATLRLYNYADYIDPAAIKSFEKKYSAYGVKVVVSTFNDADEALTKIRSGRVPYDIYVPSYDAISKLVTAHLIRPLNHTYLPHISNVWPEFTNPWYDGGWRYTVPYTVYTTGIGWRTDKVSTDVAKMANPYDIFWDRAYVDRLAVIDDWHTAMGMVLLRNRITDLNTTEQKNLDLIGTQLSQMQKATHPKVTVTMYNDLPAGQLSVSQMWSGDAVNTLSYLPKGVDPGVLRYWYPTDGRGSVDNDLMVVLRGGKNPVLAHLFLDHMLDKDTALANFSFIGYQPPQNSINAAKLVADQYVPATLASATVLPEYFTKGYRLLELPTDVDARWHAVWQRFKAGA